MPTFDSRGPISVNVEIGVGEIRMAASDRTDTVVEVRPADPSKQGDVTAAEQTMVDYSDGALRIKSAKGWRQYSFRGGAEAIHVIIELPAGSTVAGEAGVGTLHATGRFSDFRHKSGAGDIQIDEAASVSLKTSAGDITVGRAAGHCDIATSSGGVRLGTIDGTAVVKNSNGDTEIGDITGDLRVSAANGKVGVDRAGSTVAVKAANGDIRLGEVMRGSVVASTAYGRVDVGVRQDVAAWLDLNTAFGKVHSDLDATDRPAQGEDVVELKARTAYGDVTIRRAVGHPNADHQ
jgi:Putative adhesin